MRADDHTAPGFYRTLRSAAQYRRIAPCAVHLVDQGSVGARLFSDRGIAEASVYSLPGNSSAGAGDGYQRISAAKDDADPARCQPAADDDAVAGNFHNFPGELSGGSLAILFRLEHAGSDPAILPQ